MNNFKSIRVISEADADEYILDDDDSEEELAPRADGEAEFVDLHTAVSIAHPVAGDNQFKSDKDHVDHTGAESDNAEGEDKPVKQGTSGDTKFAQFRDKLGKTPARKGDKSQGDMKAETVKEEVELDEDKEIPDMIKHYEDMLKSLERKKKKTPGTGFAKIKIKEIIAKLKKDLGEEVELQEKPADFIRLTFNSPADVKKAKKWMDQNLPGANQGFTGMDASGKDIEFEDVDDAEDLMAKLKKAGFKFKVDYREELVKEEVELDEAVKAGMMKLKDGKSIKVSPDEAKMFNDVMKELNPENRKRMEMEMMKNQGSYKTMLTFAKRTR